MRGKWGRVSLVLICVAREHERFFEEVIVS